MFLAIVGAEAGNMALRCLARGQCTAGRQDVCSKGATYSGSCALMVLHRVVAAAAESAPAIADIGCGLCT